MRHGRSLSLGWHMRDIISRVVWNPWVYRITCAVVTLAGMIGVGIGLRALKATNDTFLIAAVCIPGMAGLLLFGWWMERRGIGPE